MLDIVREDLATVAARRQTVWREGDEDVRVPASGFSLAGTLSKPAGPPAGRLPVVVLVQGSGERDRDEIISGVPVFGQLASQLADAGFLVLRYDKRGVGQSGGRAESVTIADYAEDVRAAVRYLADRRDVDRHRIAVIGHGEGAAVALLTAQREKRVAAAVLAAGFGSTGADLLLEQQRAVLERSTMTPVERQAKIDLQTRIHEAVLSGEGWDEVPAELRPSADTAWFRSLLAFDPARIMKDVKQPVLVVHGELDRQMPMAQAERLAALAGDRRKDRVSRFARFPGLNHLLTMAVTGQVDEYATLSDKQVSAEVGRTVGEWLREVLRLPPAPTSRARAGTSSPR
jgi:hypothetical protein